MLSVYLLIARPSLTVYSIYITIPSSLNGVILEDKDYLLLEYDISNDDRESLLRSSRVRANR